MGQIEPRTVLLSVADGPEGFEIYESNEEGAADWASTYPALYLTAAINGANVKLGPFSLPGIREQLLKQLIARKEDEV